MLTAGNIVGNIEQFFSVHFGYIIRSPVTSVNGPMCYDAMLVSDKSKLNISRSYQVQISVVEARYLSFISSADIDGLSFSFHAIITKMKVSEK